MNQKTKITVLWVAYLLELRQSVMKCQNKEVEKSKDQNGTQTHQMLLSGNPAGGGNPKNPNPKSKQRANSLEISESLRSNLTISTPMMMRSQISVHLPEDKNTSLNPTKMMDTQKKNSSLTPTKNLRKSLI